MIPSRNMFVQYRVVNGVKYIAKNYDVFALDEIGEQVWEAIDGETSVEQIADVLSNKYDVNKDIVLHDVNDFVKDLLAKELIEV